jgi:hypothetical protein
MPESHLRLSRDQEQELIAYLDHRITSLEGTNKDRIDADKDSRRAYERDYSKRASEPIYMRSNHNIPLTSLVVDHFASRSEDEITGQSPFFDMRPKGETTPDEAMAGSRFLRDKLDGDGRLRKAINDSYQSCFTQRAVIFKAVHRQETDTWKEYGRIALFDRFTQNFARAQDGQYVLYDESPWDAVQDVTPEGEDVVMYQSAIAPDVRLPEALYRAKPGDEVFNREGVQYVWAELDKPIERSAVLEKGARSIMVESDKFLAPMNVKSLDDADCLIECYDRSVEWVENNWLKAPGREPWKDAKVTYLYGDGAEKRNQSINQEGGQKTTRSDVDDEDKQYEDMNPMHRIYEAWLVRPLKPGEKPTRFMVRYDKKNQRLIYYEYASSMLPRPTMRHPYSSACLNPKPNRWWGESLVEIITQDQEAIDRQMNRWMYRNSIATNPIIKYDPEKTVEQKEWTEVKPFEVLTPLNGVALSEIIEAFVFPQAEMNTKDIIDRIIFFVQLWLGISNLAQGDSSQMPANPTAFGQDMMLREAGKISKRWSRRLIAGIENHIEKLAYIELDTMGEREPYIYSDGNQDLVDYLERQSVESLNLKIELVVTAEKTQLTIEANRLAEEIVLKYNEHDPLTKLRVRALYKKNLMTLGYEDTEEILPMPTPEDILAWQEAQQEQADLERRQIEAQIASQTQQNNAPAGGGDKPKNRDSQKKKPPERPSPTRGAA